MGWMPENVRGGCFGFGIEELVLLFLLLKEIPACSLLEKVKIVGFVFDVEFLLFARRPKDAGESRVGAAGLSSRQQKCPIREKFISCQPDSLSG